MDIIPVIDVRHGLAVRAVRGQRTEYRPLETPFAQSSDPIEVALGLRSLFTLPALYVADLDGIEGRGRNLALPSRLAEALPDVMLWIGRSGNLTSPPSGQRSSVNRHSCVMSASPIAAST